MCNVTDINKSIQRLDVALFILRVWMLSSRDTGARCGNASAPIYVAWTVLSCAFWDVTMVQGMHVHVHTQHKLFCGVCLSQDHVFRRQTNHGVDSSDWLAVNSGPTCF